MKLKIRDFVLCGIILIALILLIPAIRALSSPGKYAVDPQYMSFLSGLIVAIKGRMSYLKMIKTLGVIQLIQMLGTAAVGGLTLMSSMNEKKSGLFTIISIVLGFLALDWIWLDGAGFSFYSFLSILIFLASIASPIVGKVCGKK